MKENDELSEAEVSRLFSYASVGDPDPQDPHFQRALARFAVREQRATYTGRAGWLLRHHCGLEDGDIQALLTDCRGGN